MTTLSACLIVRDEEENLDVCLEALVPWVDEICVIDTGSSDGTLDIAKRFDARIGHFEWCDDFAAARNASLELATSDWILVVDADEILDPESAEGIRALLEIEGPQAFLVWLDNLDGSLDANGRPGYQSVGLPRLFRRRPDIRFERPVHESVMGSLIALGAGSLEHSHVRLVHHGYLPDAIRKGDKHARNLALLERRHAAEPGDLFNAYKLATTLVAVARDDEARELYAGLWSAARARTARERAEAPFLPLVASEGIRLLAASGAHSRALELAGEALEDYPTVSEILYRTAEVERCTGNLERASELYVQARSSEAWTDLYQGEPGTRAWLPLFGLARVSALAGDLQLAENCLARGMELAPRDLEGRALRVRLASVAGREAEAWQELGELLSESPGQAHVILLAAEMAWAREERPTARGFWQGALENPLARQAAKAWLCMADLVEGDLEAARSMGADLRAADLPEAGAWVVLRAVTGAPDVGLDNHFQVEALLGEVRAWLGELARDPDGVGLAAFAQGAAALSQELPGLESVFLPS